MAKQPGWQWWLATVSNQPIEQAWKSARMLNACSRRQKSQQWQPAPGVETVCIRSRVILLIRMIVVRAVILKIAKFYTPIYQGLRARMHTYVFDRYGHSICTV